MQIFIETITGKITTLEVESTDTIGDVKSKFQRETGSPRYWQRIILDNKQLEDDKTLEEYNIENDSTLYVVLNFTSGWMKSFDTINNTKATSENKDLTPLDQQCPEDGRTEVDYNFQKESIIEVKEEVPLDPPYPMDCRLREDNDTQKESIIEVKEEIPLYPPFPMDCRLREDNDTQKESIIEVKEEIPLDQPLPEDGRTREANNTQKESTIPMKIFKNVSSIKEEDQSGFEDLKISDTEDIPRSAYCPFKGAPSRAM